MDLDNSFFSSGLGVSYTVSKGFLVRFLDNSPLALKIKSAIHHFQVKQISVNEMSMNYRERGQSFCIKSPKAEMILKPRVNYSKSSLKNPLDTVYETPKPDDKKLLSRSIVFYKDPADSALKRRIAKFFRNGKEICVVAGHPQFAQAKREEKARLKQEKKQAALDAIKGQTKEGASCYLGQATSCETYTTSFCTTIWNSWISRSSSARWTSTDKETKVQAKNQEKIGFQWWGDGIILSQRVYFYNNSNIHALYGTWRI